MTDSSERDVFFSGGGVFERSVGLCDDRMVEGKKQVRTG